MFSFYLLPRKKLYYRALFLKWKRKHQFHPNLTPIFTCFPKSKNFKHWWKILLVRFLSLVCALAPSNAIRNPAFFQLKMLYFLSRMYHCHVRSRLFRTWHVQKCQVQPPFLRHFLRKMSGPVLVWTGHSGECQVRLFESDLTFRLIHCLRKVRFLTENGRFKVATMKFLPSVRHTTDKTLKTYF